MSAAEKLASLKVKLDVVKGPHAGKSFDFSKSAITVGRGVENDVVLMNDPQVSRQHIIIELINQEFVVRNLSEKNVLFADGQSVQKWSLTNGAHFRIGDSEIQFTFDLGQAVRNVKQNLQSTKPVTTEPSSASQLAVKGASLQPAQKIKMTPPAQKNNVAANPNVKSQQKPLSPFLNRASNQTRSVGSGSARATSVDNKKPFYILIGVIVLALTFVFLTPNASKKVGKRKPAMKYEDEIEYNLRSEPEKKLQESLEQKRELRNSPQALRAEENFIRGMRDFQLGNYTRAMDNFQVVLNLDPEHALAKRYLYLAKVRFDELVQTKLMLGESNYQKHNFSMCESYYQQVIDMLPGQTNNPKYAQAVSMVKKCQFAQEGVR